MELDEGSLAGLDAKLASGLGDPSEAVQDEPILEAIGGDDDVSSLSDHRVVEPADEGDRA